MLPVTEIQKNPASEKKRVICFDWIRIFSCLCVTIVHFNASISAYNGSFVYPNSIIPNFYLDNRVYLGGIGVSLFFILSGATQMLTYKEGNLAGFYKKHFLSLFPMYWIAFTIANIIDFLMYKTMASGRPLSFFYSVAGVDGYMNTLGLSGYDYYKLGEWFLGCILLLYVLFPLLHFGVKKMPIPAVILAVSLYVFFEIHPNIGSFKIGGCEFFLRIPELLFGMLFVKYRLWERKKQIWLIAATAIALLLAWLFRNRVSSLTITIALCSFLFSLFSLLENVAWRQKIRERLAFFSVLTYPVFLVHHKLIEKLIIGFDLANFPRTYGYMMFIIYAALTLILAWLLQKAGNHFIRTRLFTCKMSNVLWALVFAGIIILPSISVVSYATASVNVISKTQAVDTVSSLDELSIVDDGDQLYQYLDLCGSHIVQGNSVSIEPGSEQCYFEGWAIDPKAGIAAGAVYLQVGNQLYCMNYGKKRQSVVDAFGNEAYLNSGYTILLDTVELLEAGEIAIHVISADGTYRYPPVMYRVEGVIADKPEADKTDGLPILEYNGNMSYQYLDLCGDIPASTDAIYVDAESEILYIEGWAVDPVNGGTASGVVIDVGVHEYKATYGKPRQTVADAYGDNSYLNCGYTAILDTQEALEAGSIIVKVITADGANQYPATSYRVELLN